MSNSRWREIGFESALLLLRNLCIFVRSTTSLFMSFLVLQIYIESKLTEHCVRVRAGDRIGVYVEEAPGAIAYTFDGASLNALIHTAGNASDPQPVKVDDIVEFGSLNFPYDFSVTAYIDTNATLYNDTTDGDFPACPKGLMIPPYWDVTLPPTTPAPPVTGRPGADGATGAQGVKGSDGVDGAHGERGERGEQGKTGQQGDEGVMGAAGFNGSVGATGVRGSMGYNGSTGVKGDTGAVGPVGPRGLAGAVVTVQSPETANLQAEDDGFFSNPTYIMGLSIWVVVITIIVIIAIIVFAVTHRRRREPRETVYVDRKPQPLIADNEDRPSWMGSMKEETETNYSNETTTSWPDAPAALTTANETTTSWPDAPAALTMANETGDRQFDNAGFRTDDEMKNY